MHLQKAPQRRSSRYSAGYLQTCQLCSVCERQLQISQHSAVCYGQLSGGNTKTDLRPAQRCGWQFKTIQAFLDTKPRRVVNLRHNGRILLFLPPLLLCYTSISAVTLTFSQFYTRILIARTQFLLFATHSLKTIIRFWLLAADSQRISLLVWPFLTGILAPEITCWP
jgi:hypothetical protein